MFTFLYVEDMPDKRWLGILLQSVSLAEAAEKKRAKYFRGMIRRLGTERRSNKKSGNILAKLDNSFSRTFQTGDYLRIIIHSGMDFFLFFYQIIINLIAKSLIPDPGTAMPEQAIHYQKLMLNLSHLSPGQLFSDATTTLLMPSVRSVGPLTMEQVSGIIPSSLPLGQSLLIAWPHLTGFIAATVRFALSYIYFMRKQIRSS